MTSTVEIIKDLFCGCMSGWGQVVSMLPFQNIKIKVISKPLQYNQGYLHALTKTIKEEGIFSLYKGMLFPLIGVGAQVSMQFGIVQTLKKIMKTRYADADGNLHWKYSFISGIFSGIPSALVVTPLDHSRFRVTLNKEKGVGSVGMAKNILKQHGLKKLYLGFLPTLLRESFGLGFYFGTYDLVMKSFTHDGKVDLRGSILAGALSGIMFWLPIYPVDYVKTLIQSDSLTNPLYRGFSDCISQQSKKGVGVFYKAFGIMMARAAVCSSVGFLNFEIGKKLLYSK